MATGGATNGLLTVLNLVFIVALLAVVIAIVLSNNCTSYHPLPTREQLEKVDIVSTFRTVYRLNIMTNLMYVIPGLMIMFAGYVFEGGVLVLTALFSTMWHVTGDYQWRLLDWTFAALSAISMVLAVLRIVQVRGWPEFGGAWLILPLMGMLLWGGMDDLEDETSYINGRASHMLWHVLTGATMMMVAIELLKCTPALPNRALRASILSKDMRMWKRWEGYGGGSRTVSLGFDLFKDLANNRAGGLKVERPAFM
jgi:hypothetical protein